MSKKQKAINKATHEFYSVLAIFAVTLAIGIIIMAITSKSINVTIMAAVSIIMVAIFGYKIKNTHTR